MSSRSYSTSQHVGQSGQTKTTSRVNSNSDQTALYRHFDDGGQLLYVGISLNAIGRLVQHRQSSHWANQIAKMTVEYYPTRTEALAAEVKAIREERPLHNIVHSGAEKQQPFKLNRDFVKAQFAEIARAEHARRVEEEEAEEKARSDAPKVYKLLSLADIMAEAEQDDPPWYRAQRAWAELISHALDLETWNDVIWECADEIEFQGDLIGFFAHLFSGFRLADGADIWA